MIILMEPQDNINRQEKVIVIKEEGPNGGGGRRV